MARYTVLVVLVPSFLALCQSNKQFKQSTWITPVNKMYGFSCITFDSESTYTSSESVMEGKTLGKYLVKKDTLILLQEKGEFDYSFPENDQHREGSAIRKFLIRKAKLIPVSLQKTRQGKWAHPQITFDKDYYFKRDIEGKCKSVN